MLHEQPILLSNLLTSGQIGRSEVTGYPCSDFKFLDVRYLSEQQ